EEEGRWCPGAAARGWLHVSLQRLDEALRRLGSRLIIRRGPVLSTLRELLVESGAKEVTWNRRYEPLAARLEQEMRRRLREENAARAESFHETLLFEPWEICNRAGQPFRVFTPFWKSCLSRHPPAPPDGAPQALHAPQRWPRSLSIEDLDLSPRSAWTSGLGVDLEAGRDRRRRGLGAVPA
ncbi:MAG TPA: deoxyribodipyrimidine photo-lyase, partial [Candidatus Polarisedimenticolia bacterium]|nr:deoxyribodipyrimidine photo-lyase [Candidatus Polarisedimenticolia bacterium]